MGSHLPVQLRKSCNHNDHVLGIYGKFISFFQFSCLAFSAERTMRLLTKVNSGFRLARRGFRLSAKVRFSRLVAGQPAGDWRVGASVNENEPGENYPIRPDRIIRRLSELLL
jgi:hypothetical protein